jgi:hypothetical protein
VSQKGRLLIAAYAAITLITAAATTREFVDKAHAYSVRYPSTWVFAGDASRFLIYNFPLSKWVKGPGLPEGGASIVILVPSELHPEKNAPRTLEEWATYGSAHQNILGRKVFELENGVHRIDVIELRTRCCASAPFLEGYSWYFAVDGRMFCASVSHWEGDKGLDGLLQTLQDIVLSLRVQNSR